MGAVTRSHASRGGPRLGRLTVEGEVARGPSSVTLAARLENGNRLAVRAWDLALRVTAPDAARFEQVIDERIARNRRADETGELPKDRLYRVTDLVKGAPATLETLGSLRALLAFWVEAARALAKLHERGLAHGHLHPGHALVIDGARPLIIDAGIVVTPQAARLHPEHAALLAPESIDELTEDRPAAATRESDVYSLAASILAAIGVRPRAATLDALVATKNREKAPVIAAACVGRAIDGTALSDTLAKALAREPEKRPDAATLAAMLKALLETNGGIGK